MFSELAQYVAPKRKAVELAVEPLQIHQSRSHGMEFDALELIKKIRENTL
jgi:hypothetical protein